MFGRGYDHFLGINIKILELSFHPSSGVEIIVSSQLLHVKAPKDTYFVNDGPSKVSRIVRHV